MFDRLFLHLHLFHCTIFLDSHPLSSGYSPCKWCLAPHLWGSTPHMAHNAMWFKGLTLWLLFGLLRCVASVDFLTVFMCLFVSIYFSICGMGFMHVLECCVSVLCDCVTVCVGLWCLAGNGCAADGRRYEEVCGCINMACISH